MSTELKKNELLKLFSCFPSANTIDREQAAIMTSAYLETLSSFSSQVVSSACDALRRRSSPFPPSAGEVFAECEKTSRRMEAQNQWSAAGFPRVRFSGPLLPPQKKKFSVEEMADWNLLINHASPPYYMRVDAKGVELVIPQGYPGAGKQVSYGYLTPREADWVREQKQRKGPVPHTKDSRFSDQTDDERFADLDAFARETL